MRKPSLWKHKDHHNKKYVGQYRKNSNGSREFILSSKSIGGLSHIIKFDSHERASSLGWKKIR